MTLGGREARGRLRESAPAAYRWPRHVALIAAFAGAGVALPAAMLESVRPAEWLALVAILAFIVLGEYASHRWSMHVPRFPRVVYRRHVVEHHAFFSHRHMAIDGWDDLRWVLFPPWALPLLVASVLPIFALLAALAPANVAWLFLLAVIAYYGVYEIVHALSHVPIPPGRLGRVLAVLTRHHRVHHDPALMRSWNFNFVLPLGDWLCGTVWRPAVEAAPERDADTSAATASRPSLDATP